jgi:hypothetical protein
MNPVKRLAASAALICAVAAFGVPSATAAAPHFTSSTAVTYLKGEQQTANVITTNGGKFQCTDFTVEGAVKGTEIAAAVLHPTWTGCKAFGLPVVVTTTGCNYTVTAAGQESIQCEAGDVMKFAIPSGACSFAFGAQGPLSSLSYVNEGVGTTTSLLMKENISGLSYASTGGFCGSSGTNGTHTGSVLIKGYADASHTKQVAIGWSAS